MASKGKALTCYAIICKGGAGHFGDQRGNGEAAQRTAERRDGRAVKSAVLAKAGRGLAQIGEGTEK